MNRLFFIFSIVFIFAYHQAYSQKNGIHLGVFYSDERVQIGIGYERELFKNFSIVPTYSFSPWGFQGTENSSFWSHRGSLQLRYYFLLNKKGPLNGLYIFPYGGYYRLSISSRKEIQQRTVQPEVAIGTGFQHTVLRNFFLNTSASVGYIWATDKHFDGLSICGSETCTYQRNGYIFFLQFSLGYKF